jgi:hypothetical protein
LMPRIIFNLLQKCAAKVVKRSENKKARARMQSPI